MLTNLISIMSLISCGGRYGCFVEASNVLELRLRKEGFVTVVGALLSFVRCGCLSEPSPVPIMIALIRIYSLEIVG